MSAASPHPVRLAVEAYIESRNARASRRVGRLVRSDAAHRLERYVIGRVKHGQRKAVAAAPISEIALHRLTERNLQDWREGMSAGLKATAVQRLVGDFKAAYKGQMELYLRWLDKFERETGEEPPLEILNKNDCTGSAGVCRAFRLGMACVLHRQTQQREELRCIAGDATAGTTRSRFD